MTREELIAALERAKKPSSELDMEVALFLGYRPKEVGDYHRYTVWEAPDKDRKMRPASYTSTLSDAEELVAQSSEWCVGRAKHEYWASVEGQMASASTPALALCIAALRARA